MKPWQERLVKEQEELRVKIRKLTAALENDELNITSGTQFMLLSRQLEAMITYSECLGERIGLFRHWLGWPHTSDAGPHESDMDKKV